MKYYAVRKGRVPGIYETWESCRRQVIRFPGAEYKSFENKEDAEKFMNEELLEFRKINLDEVPIYSFVDGSYNSTTNVYGCGGFLVDKSSGEEKRYVIQGHDNEEDMVAMRNISGELMGSKMAIEKAIELGLPEITILYDYMGIEMWAKGMWDRTRTGTIAYYEYCESIKDSIQLHFVKVEGHTGIPGNEEADKLAKESVGIK